MPNKTYRVQVTADDIRRGKRESSHYCPIARALKRTFHTYVVSVVGEDVCVREDEYLLPEEAVEFQWAFDVAEPVKPFEFEMERV